MEIRLATFSDLEAIERLRLQMFSHAVSAVLDGVHPETQLAVRLKLWQRTPALLQDVLVALDGEQIVGTITVLTKENVPRFHWAHLGILRALGVWQMVRYLALWRLTQYVPAPAEAYLYGIAVHPAYQRQGVASQLSLAAEEHARRLGKCMASAFIERKNFPSIKLAQKHRFQCAAPKRNGIRRVMTRDSMFVRCEKHL
jgi:GNAT superfamily N-acetyltransferase